MTSFLEKYKRQPKIYVDLPSKGEFYNETVLEDEQFIQMPVFGMTAMDEIMLKTPDALFSGEATSQVIQSCVPYVKNPWAIVGYDLDFLLIAIRIATYGEELPVDTTCPHCSHTTKSAINLNTLLENFSQYPTTAQFTMGNLTVKLRPMDYKTTTEFNMKQYQLEKTMANLNQSDLSSDEKDAKITELLFETSKLNLLIAVSHIVSIEADGEAESNPEIIYNFISENDSEFYNSLRENIKTLTDRWKLPNIDVQCANEECQILYPTKLNMDYSSFFGLPSSRSRTLKF